MNMDKAKGERDIQYMVLFLVFGFSLLMFPLPAMAETPKDISQVIYKTAVLLKNAALIMGPALGLIFSLSGLMKIKKKEDNPNEFSKGISYIVIGITCTILGLFVSWVLSYYGTTFGDDYNILTPTFIDK